MKFKLLESQQLKVYLDDERTTPEGWTRTYWPEDTIELLKQGNVSELSLDHDLGEEGPEARTGYDVVLWIEEQTALNGFIPPKIKVHSSNSSAREKMESGIESINRFARRT